MQRQGSARATGSPLNSPHGSRLILHHDPSSRIVKLNVGGTRHTTTSTTLLQVGDSFFSALLRGAIPAFKDEEGALFIDRSGRVFEEILNWMRSGHIRIGPNASREELVAEANFYLLPSLLAQLHGATLDYVVASTPEEKLAVWAGKVKQLKVISIHMHPEGSPIDECINIVFRCAKETAQYGRRHVKLTMYPTDQSDSTIASQDSSPTHETKVTRTGWVVKCGASLSKLISAEEGRVDLKRTLAAITGLSAKVEWNCYRTWFLDITVSWAENGDVPKEASPPPTSPMPKAPSMRRP